MYFFFRKMIFFTPEKINANQIIIHHHLGLGDNIICFGLITKLSEKYDKIYLLKLTNSKKMQNIVEKS